MTITDDIFAQLSGAPMQQISQQLGLGQTQTAGAIAAALPMLIGALGRNASQPQGAEALFGALQRDHAGGGMGLGDVLGAVLGGQQSRQTDGAGMLGHIFGSRQPQAEQAIGQATGLGSDKANTLLKVLAPLVLAYLAKRFFDNRQAGAAQQSASPQVLGDLLGQERRQISQQGGLGGGLLGAVLDRDGDGDVDIGDIFKAGMGMMGRR
ncbi:MAG: calcium-binding protein [Pseudoxanthomonas suwonensis]|nr:MAG: calcium-binding protein [Pseudoxanthomonas suwonensis]